MSHVPTERLYLRDPYTTEFEAEIVERIESEDGPAVVFPATYFYPESGGQPYDLGTIDGIPVTRVIEADDHRVLHFLERLPVPDSVACRIDADRRRDHMQQHSGQHILSAAFVKEASAGTVSFHLGASVSTIDLDRERIGSEEIDRAERAANEAVRRALPILSRFISSGEAQGLDLRKPPPEAPSLRIVEIEGFDRQACCGTHPRTSSEVGPILVRGAARVKGGTRVEFVCGDRALRDYRTTVSRIRALASTLSASEPDLAETAERLQDERKLMAKELERLRSELLVLRVEDWMGEAERLPGFELLVKVVDGAGPSELRTAAVELTKKPGRVVLLGSVHEGRAHLVFAGSDSTPSDMGSLLKAALADVAGRGGGSARIAQGGGPRTEGLAAALERGASTVRG